MEIGGTTEDTSFKQAAIDRPLTLAKIFVQLQAGRPV